MVEEFSTNITKKPCYDIPENKTRESCTDMFKKISTISVLSFALLVSGVVTTPAIAAANDDQKKDKTYSKKVYYSINGEWNQISLDKCHEFIKKFEGKQEQPKAEEIEKPVKGEEVKPEEPKEEPKEELQEEPTEEPKEESKEEPKEEVEVEQDANDEELNEEVNKDEQPEADESLSAYEQEVVELTNNEREKQGLSPLKANTELSHVAREKSNDMANNNYFDHQSPQYGSPFDMMKAYGITYRTAGENIARGQQTPEEVVNGWMNSEGHRANILNGDFTEIGVGFVEKGNHWTQQFIGK